MAVRVHKTPAPVCGLVAAFLVYAVHMLGNSPVSCVSAQDTGQDTSIETDGLVKLSDGRLRSTRTLFEDKCALCHEENGNSSEERLNLVDNQWNHGGTLADIRHTIAEGVPETKMKSMKNKLGMEEMADLALYVKWLGLQNRMLECVVDETVDSEQVAIQGTVDLEPTRALPPVEELVGLRLVPSASKLWGEGARQQFMALGAYRDGIERDVTGSCRFIVDNEKMASVDSEGLVRGQRDGRTRLTAELGSLHSKAVIEVEASQTRPPFSFERRIGGVLTRRGCNASTCHGGVKGRGGFKLALNVLYPDEDYDWIVRGGGYQVLSPEPEGERIPRVNIEQPEQSLLLLKPTYQVEHEGGKILSRDSKDFKTILEWVRAGAVYEEPGAGELKIKHLEVYPREAVLRIGESHRLVVMAQLANGRKEDVTDQVNFESGNREILKVTDQGLVHARGIGETTIMISAAAAWSNARFGVIEKVVADYPDVPRHNLIDEHVFAKLDKFQIVPSGLSSDEEFLRRACLDLTGTLPPPKRVREFLADQDPDKRGKLVNLLLETPEYVDYWTLRFAELFRVGPGASQNEVYHYWSWIRECINRNIPYDKIARDRIAAEGYGFAPSRYYGSMDKNSTMHRAMAETVRVFMGRRLDCAQCHNHPRETWSQDQFWGLAAFYARLTTTDWTNNRLVFDDPEGQAVDWGEKGEENLKFVRAIQPRSGREMLPTYFDGTVLEEKDYKDPRLHLADWITHHPFFSEALVNRIWSYFFGMGIVDPVDDFDSRNIPTHPELLRELSRDFREHGHDLKHLMRRITSSRTYHLSSMPNETNRADNLNYSHALPRVMKSEVLLDAVSSVTGVPAKFDRTNSSGGGGIMPRGIRAVQLMVPARWPSRFIEAYGRNFRSTLPETDDQPKLAQALHLLVGDTFTEQLAGEDGRIDRFLERNATNREIVEEFYLAALSRLPSEEELDGLARMMQKRSPMVDEPFFGQNQVRREVLQDLLWALISCREFIYNH